MHGIPPAKDTDAEDVVWGLQTADTLWKRGERIDAVVWLRRAAQSAGDEGDDDRALELARLAAELSDWMASGQLSEPPPQLVSRTAASVSPPAQRAPMSTLVPDGERSSRNSIDIEVDDESARSLAPEISFPSGPAPLPLPRPQPPRTQPPSQPTMQTAEPVFDAPDPAEEEPAPSKVNSVPPAEQVHAGLFNPWDDRGSAMPPEPVAPPPPPDPKFHDDDEIVTSVRPHQLVAQRAETLAALFAGGAPQSEAPPAPRPSAWAEDDAEPKAPPPGVVTTVPTGSYEVPSANPPPLSPPTPPTPPKAPPRPPPPLPARALKNKPSEAVQQTALPFDLEATVPVARPSSPPPGEPIAMRPRAGSATSLLEAPPAPIAPAALRVASQPPERMTPPPPSPTHITGREEPAAVPEPTSPSISAAPVELPESLDLDDVEAFADLPDDARRAFASAAKVSALAEGEEVSAFALAYVLSGSVDVAATMVDAPAARLERGSVLRARGTTDDGVPMRLIGVESGVVATWSDAAVTDAFRTCPWVEEDLRVAADRWQTLVGVTIGPLGERLDTSIRQQIIDRLEMRTLISGDVVVTAGDQMPGLFLIGVGELELMDGDTVTGTIGSGDFLFPTEVLGAGRAPYTARAGAGGALILFGDRMIAQELLVTCPPLLEVFAGM